MSLQYVEYSPFNSNTQILLKLRNLIGVLYSSPLVMYDPIWNSTARYLVDLYNKVYYQSLQYDPDNIRFIICSSIQCILQYLYGLPGCPTNPQCRELINILGVSLSYECRGIPLPPTCFI